VGSRECIQWISPNRSIEFKRCTGACEFEELRKINDSDEDLSRNEYCKIEGDARIVCPTQYAEAKELRPGPDWTFKLTGEIRQSES
jgi:hypothetical protein